MKNILYKYWHILILLILSSLVVWPLVLPGYFSHHDDLQVMRIFEIRKCLLDYQIPCRWVPDMGYGNGYPLFNYYNPFPYYIGALLSFLLGFIGAAKVLFFIPLILAPISMYFLAKEISNRSGAILAASLYLFAPYRALDSYVRGAVAESFAIAIIPLVFYFAFKLIKFRSTKYLVGLSVSLAAFLTSHTILTIIFLPILILVIIYWCIHEKINNFKYIIVSLLLGVGLSAFFTFPAYWEKDLVQTDNLIRLDLNFRAHFATFNQLFLSRFWGYGASTPGSLDTISFQIGWPHWWIVVAAVLFSLLQRKNIRSAILFILIFAFSVFMTHNKSAFIWERIEILKYTQFPWRFLSVSIFAASLLGAVLIKNLGGTTKKLLAIFLIILTIVLNWSYFKPKEFYLDMTDQQKLTGQLWQQQQKAAILDYLPKTAVEPREPAPTEPKIISGKAAIEKFESHTNSWQFQTKVDKSASIEIPVFDFPNWQVRANNLDLDHNHQNYLGRISINLKPGNYFVMGKLQDTPIRTISNIITAFSFLALLIFALDGKLKRFFK